MVIGHSSCSPALGSSPYCFTLLFTVVSLALGTINQERGIAMSTLRETFVDELADIYDAEKQLVKALPKIAKAASHEELKEAFESHLEETENHVTRLEQVFGSIGE